MKSFLKRIAFAFIAVLTLTACDSLLPMPRRQSNSTSNNESSLTSRSNQPGDNPNFKVISNQPDIINISTYADYTADFFLYDEANHANVRISSDSFAESNNRNLKVTYDAFFSSLQVTFNTAIQGTYNVDITLVSSDGFSYERSFEVYAYDTVNECYLTAPDSVSTYIGSSTTVEFRVFNPNQNRYIALNENQPFTLDACGPELELIGHSLGDNNTQLTLRLHGVIAGSNNFSVTLYATNGGQYSQTITYSVRDKNANYKVACELNPIIIETGSSSSLNFYLKDQEGNQIEMRTDYYVLNDLNSEFSYSIVEFSPYNLKIQFKDVNNGGASDFSLSVKSANGVEYVGYFTIYSRLYYESAMVMNLDVKEAGNNRYCLNINVAHMDGSLATMTSIHIKCPDNIFFDEANIENINVTEYNFYFTLKAHGSNYIDVDVGTSKGVWVASGIYVSL